MYESETTHRLIIGRTWVVRKRNLRELVRHTMGKTGRFQPHLPAKIVIHLAQSATFFFLDFLAWPATGLVERGDESNAGPIAR
jgi:hypothetical protein